MSNLKLALGAIFVSFVFVSAVRMPSRQARAAFDMPAAVPSEGAGLADINLQLIRANKTGFGNVLEATFSISNRNRYPVKDLTVTCHHAANSGSVIDSNTRTIYELIPANGSTYVNDFNMGFVNTQSVRTLCEVTGFRRA